MNLSISTVLEVGLGLALVYYVLSLIVSYITSTIAEWTDLRAKDLEVGLKELIDDDSKRKAFLGHPLIKNLETRKARFLGGIKPGSLEAIPAETFAEALLAIVAPGAKDPNPQKALADTRALIDSLPPDSATRKALLGLIDSGAQNLEEARKLIVGWFDDSMTKVSLLYKQHARHIAIIVALVVTIVTGVDSIAVAEYLWQEPSARAAVTTKVDEYLKEEPQGDVQAYISDLEELEIPILWDADTLPEPGDVAGWAWKIAGLLLTWVAAAQGSSFWYQILKRIRSAATAPPPTGSTET